MPVNIIDAILNLVNNPIYSVGNYYNQHNRANNMGAALEEYVKDLFAGTVTQTDTQLRLARFSDIYSYMGNQNNPPDFMIKDGLAVEVKKVENFSSSLALNSSYPKTKLTSNSPMITSACRLAENWTEKDFVYAVGVVNGQSISHLSFVYGIDYAASDEIYSRIKTRIKEGVNLIPGVEFGETNELARINRVDPLGITYLRVRGMWGIENPFVSFKYIYTPDRRCEFNFFAIIEENTYNSMENKLVLERLANDIQFLQITRVRIKTPDNPVLLKDVVLITFKR